MLIILCDENISQSDKFIKDNPDYKNAKELFGIGASDLEILEHADKDEHVIYTRDIKLALHALIKGFRVWYHDQETNKDHCLTACMSSNNHN